MTEPRDGSAASETEQIEFIQIAAAKDHLYGLTRAGTVWRYNDDRRRWDALSMTSSSAPSALDGRRRPGTRMDP